MLIAPAPSTDSPATAASSPQPPTLVPPPTSPLHSPSLPAAPTPSPLAFAPSVSPAIDHTPLLPLVPLLPTSPPPAILISPITSPPAPLRQSVVTPPPHAAAVTSPAASPPPPQSIKSLPFASKPKPLPPPPKSASPPHAEAVIAPAASPPPPQTIKSVPFPSKPKPLPPPPPKSASPPLKPSSTPSPLPEPVDTAPFWLASPPPTLSPSVFANEKPIYQASGSPSPSASRPLPLAVSNGRFDGSSSRTAHSSIGLVVACTSVGVLFFLLVALVFIWCKARNKSNKRLVNNHKFHQFEPKGKSSIVPPQRSQDVLPSENHVVTMTVQPQPAASPPVLTSSIAVNVSANSDSAVDSSNGSFTYEQLVAAANGFSDANLLGQGGFGYVHKGVLPDGKEVAVKQLSEGSHQGEREFQAELETISRVHHKHLVSLLGYCISGAQRLLVYEFVPNKTLEFHLHEDGQPVIDWETRLKIAIGAAKGLAYLHEDCNPTIIHRDIKAANILLDSKFEAKVSDFGLAKYFNTSSPITHITTRVVGTFGYLAPEYASTGHLTDRSDVYSYGVVLLELITGRPAIGVQESSSNKGLVEWARPLLSQALKDGDFRALADPKLNENYNESEMSSMVTCAAACVRQSGWFRPPMSQVVRVLEGDASVAYLDERVRPAINTTSISSESWIYNDQHEDTTKPSKSSIISKSYGISGFSESTS